MGIAGEGTGSLSQSLGRTVKYQQRHAIRKATVWVFILAATVAVTEILFNHHYSLQSVASLGK